MARMQMIKTSPPPSTDEKTKQIEEVAYYKWLDRGRYAQPGDELNDWFEAEKEFRDSLQSSPSTPKLLPSKAPADKRKN
jgi:hypothetical protein